MFQKMILAITLLCIGEVLFAADNDSGPRVTPQNLILNHHRQPRSIQVLSTSKDGYTMDHSTEARYSSASPSIARVDSNGWVYPVSNGKTAITVNLAGKSIPVTVEVNIPAKEPVYSFLQEVMPVLSQAGCNMGACHGYSLGKNGFKLSLRGSDP
ncbi:MAG: hypothetical protein ACK47R_23045, partial [Planctomycetia bacterium]